MANIVSVFFVSKSLKFSKFVNSFWLDVFFLQFIFVVVVDPCGQIEKWIFSGGESKEHGGRSRNDFFFLKNLYFCWTWKFENFVQTYGFLTFPWFFPALPGASRYALASYNRIHKPVVPNSHTVGGTIGSAHGKNCFHYLGREIVEMIEICKFLGPTVFFCGSALLSLLICVFKSKMDFQWRRSKGTWGSLMRRKNWKNAFLLDLINRKFCFDISFLNASVYFPALLGAARWELASYYVFRRAVRPKIITFIGMIGPVHSKNPFRYLDLELEMLEICAFVWPNRIFPQFIFLSLLIRVVESKINSQRWRMKGTWGGRSRDHFFLKTLNFCWTWTNRKFCLDI